MASSLNSGPVYFCFAVSTGISGQIAATEMVIRGLRGRGWTCRVLSQPVLDREGGRVLARFRYGARLLAAWMRSLSLLRARRGWLYLNLGQTRSAFFRATFPLLLGSLCPGRARTVISLHGNLFLRWPDTSLETRWFRFLLGRAGRVTVLGEGQRARLLALGVPDSCVTILLNSCALEPASVNFVRAKHSEPHGNDRPVRCLHLGGLYCSKGFPEYLGALLQMSTEPGIAVNAVLCGPLIEGDSSDRFNDTQSAERWIEGTMEQINRSARVRVRWIKGAYGAEKEALFREADLFILPTHYAIEAQPLVLLEAMASGCAIITTRAGEIPAILDEQTAVLLPEVSIRALVTAVDMLVENGALRRDLAIAAHARFMKCYQVERHLDSWEALLNDMGAIPAGV